MFPLYHHLKSLIRIQEKAIKEIEEEINICIDTKEKIRLLGKLETLKIDLANNKKLLLGS